MAASRARQAATPSEATPGKLDRCARLPIALYSKDTLIQTASGKYHVGFDLSDHKDPAHNRDHTTNEFGKIKTLNIGAIPFAKARELKFSRTPRYCRYVRPAKQRKTI